MDVVLFDPPYNIGKDYADDETGDKLPDAEYDDFMNAALIQCWRVLKPGGVLWYWCNADQGGDVYRRTLGWKIMWGSPIIWWERFSQYQSKRFTQDFRYIFPLVRDDSPNGNRPNTFNGQDILIPSERMKKKDKRAADSKGKVPGKVWTDRRLQGTSVDRVDWHPLQLPPEQMERIILGFTNPGDLVMDAFMGSGGSGVVARRLGRRYVGVDKSRTYVEAARRRVLELGD